MPTNGCATPMRGKSLTCREGSLSIGWSKTVPRSQTSEEEGLGEFIVRVGSEPNDHLRLARLHEFSFDFVPCAALPGITSGRLQPSIEFSLLRVG